MQGQMNMTVKLTRIDRDRTGARSVPFDLRVRTRSGIKALKLIGECMAAGGTVSAKTWYDEAGDEWMKAHLDWATAGEET